MNWMEQWPSLDEQWMQQWVLDNEQRGNNVTMPIEFYFTIEQKSNASNAGNILNSNQLTYMIIVLETKNRMVVDLKSKLLTSADNSHLW